MEIYQKQGTDGLALGERISKDKVANKVQSEGKPSRPRTSKASPSASPK